MFSVYKGKKIIITGHTGFKGSWLSLWLKLLGAKVIGLSVNLPSKPSNFEVCKIERHIREHRVDIRDKKIIRKIVKKEQPDFIFHLAAQALVPKSYKDPLYTMEVNSMGSANILDSLRVMDKPVTAVMITSDKVYDNLEWSWGYRERDRLGGKDPYSASKGMAELAIRTYIKSFFNSPDSNVCVGISRAGNVIGGGDWAEDRIVPDCMRAWAYGKEVIIRNSEATRPWQHVLEPLSGYLMLGANLAKNRKRHGQAYNFGPSARQNHTVRELIDEMSKYWKNIRWKKLSNENRQFHEAGLLKLNCDKALSDLNWTPTLQFIETVRMTTNWYKTYYDNPNKSMYDFTRRQIDEYTSLGASRGLSWVKT